MQSAKSRLGEQFKVGQRVLVNHFRYRLFDNVTGFIEYFYPDDRITYAIVRLEAPVKNKTHYRYDVDYLTGVCNGGAKAAEIIQLDAYDEFGSMMQLLDAGILVDADVHTINAGFAVRVNAPTPSSGTKRPASYDVDSLSKMSYDERRNVTRELVKAADEREEIDGEVNLVVESIHKLTGRMTDANYRVERTKDNWVYKFDANGVSRVARAK